MPRALGAALDEGLDAVLDGEGAAALDDLLLRAGLLEPLAARLEIRALRVPNDEERARLFEELARLYAGPLSSPARAASAHVRALAADPTHKEALVALRAYASSARDPMPLAEALIRAISTGDDTEESTRRAGRLLCARTLATVADEQLGEVGVAAWALERVVWFSAGDSAAESALARCTPRVAELLQELERARRERASAKNDEVAVDALRKMSLVLRALPGRADELAEVLAELARRVPGERRFAAEAARIGWRRGDLAEVTRLARTRLNETENAADRVEACSVLAAAAHASGDAAAANEATRRLIDEPSPSREAAGAAWMNAALAGDKKTRARALAIIAGTCAKPLRAVPTRPRRRRSWRVGTLRPPGPVPSARARPSPRTCEPLRRWRRRWWA